MFKVVQNYQEIINFVVNLSIVVDMEYLIILPLKLGMERYLEDLVLKIWMITLMIKEMYNNMLWMTRQAEI